MSKGQVFTPATARKILQEIDKGPQRNPRNKTRRDLPAPQYFRNNASEAVPAWGVMRVSDIVEHNGLIMFEIEKPDDTVGLFVFNTGHEVAAKSGSTYDVGLCQQGPYFKAIYDTGTPSNGDIYGVDGWELSGGSGAEAFAGFEVFGIHDTDDKTIICQRTPNAGRIVVTPAGGIAAATKSSNDYTPGSASCDICTWDGTKWTKQTDTFKIYNIVPNAIAGDTLIQAKLIDGVWVADVEPCGEY